RAHSGQEEEEGKRRPPADPLREPTERRHAEERAGVHHERGHAGPDDNLAADVPGLVGAGEAQLPRFRLKGRAEDRLLEVVTEEADPPEADDAGEGEQHAEHRVAAYPAFPEQLGVRAELLADPGRRRVAGLAPGNRL